MFNIFSGTMAPNNNVYPTWTWSTGIKDADGKDISVTDLISKYNTLLNENKILREELESIEEDIEEYKKGNKNWMNLYQEVVDKNNELLKTNNRLTVDNNALLNKGGLKYMEAKLQTVQHGYDKCSRERDEFKHQLNAANKEIEALKKEKKESFEILKKAIEDESDRFHDLVSKSVDTEISLKKENEKLKSKLRDYQDRSAESFSYSDMKKLQNKVDEQKEENEKLKKDIIDYVYEKDEQKHPMYPIHWGGYDGAASAHPEEYKKWLDEQRDKAITEKEVEFDAEELLRRTTEFAESLAKEPSWEQAASDLALRVVKLEKMVEELKIINTELTMSPLDKCVEKYGD